MHACVGASVPVRGFMCVCVQRDAEAAGKRMNVLISKASSVFFTLTKALLCAGQSRSK